MSECVICNGSFVKDTDPDKLSKKVKICVAHNDDINVRIKALVEWWYDPWRTEENRPK